MKNISPLRYRKGELFLRRTPTRRLDLALDGVRLREQDLDLRDDARATK
jgi:hypothetical protein